MRIGQTVQKQNVNLAPLTTIGIGGVAETFFSISSDHDARKLYKKLGDECFILGKGSNILIDDGVIRRPVIMLGQQYSYINCNNDMIEIGAATPFSQVMQFAVKHNYAGLIQLAGIPATVGGMLRMNASAHDVHISDFVCAVEAVNRQGQVVLYRKSEMSFGYRSSSLHDVLILRVWFSLPHCNDARQHVRQVLWDRRRFQDFEFPSCGCVFKNPPQGAAGYLIDQCGLKGYRYRDVCVSNRHANFIINCGNATYQDVDTVIQHIKQAVHDRFSVVLEEEIQRWGCRPVARRREM